ncbi:unnamed protein product [Tetraodon nigroviridis]|uniref:(spotted green pufferfish) hypothetical protein n=1 Tax=Tetraodon nigroviridis TaxID=99883 RepID=Q4RHM5_TETNG|nr:unnamed protein product [Tetraodon nigroviridis]
MGCNLCTLQKREEHYKLLYEIAQVKLSNCSLRFSSFLPGFQVNLNYQQGCIVLSCV